MKINVYPNKTMFGKRTGKHTAELGEFNAEGKTATDAKAALLQTIAEYRPLRYVIGTVDGPTFIVTRNLAGGIDYAICGAGRDYASGCLMATTDAREGIERARKHAAESFGGIAWQHAF